MTDPPLVAVIDHGAGNLVSIRHGLERAGARVAIASRPQETASAQALVLPGVGAPGTAMSRLRDRGFIEPIRTWKGPLLGICIGLQLFFEMSEEDGESCLGLERGRVRKIPDAPLLPHIGWNDLVLPRNGSAPDQLFGDIDPEATFYFVHSYVPVPEDDGITIAYAEYPHPFTAAIRNGPRIGVQFHPERSGDQGIRFLANFVAEVRKSPRASQ